MGCPAASRSGPLVKGDLSREGAPDATTLLHFRRLLGKHDLTRAIFQAINGHLAEQGLLLSEGNNVDNKIIAASPSLDQEPGEGAGSGDAIGQEG
jgi:hypothetical protein